MTTGLRHGLRVLGALTLAVLGLHLVGLDWVARQTPALPSSAEAPARIEVAFVRELAPTAPPPAEATAVPVAPAAPARATSSMTTVVVETPMAGLGSSTGPVPVDASAPEPPSEPVPEPVREPVREPVPVPVPEPDPPVPGSERPGLAPAPVAADPVPTPEVLATTPAASAGPDRRTAAESAAPAPSPLAGAAGLPAGAAPAAGGADTRPSAAATVPAPAPAANTNAALPVSNPSTSTSTSTSTSIVPAPVLSPVPPPRPDVRPPVPLAPTVSSVPATAATSPAPPGPVESAVAPVRSAPAFEWPPSTRLSYALVGDYRGPVHGTATVEWLRSGPRYQVHLDVRVGPEMTPLMTRRMSSDGEITPQGLRPRRYDEVTRVLFSTRRRGVSFEPDRVVLAGGGSAALLPGVQDTASQFVQMTWFFNLQPQRLRVGDTLDMPLALPNRVSLWRYDIVAQEALALPFGTVSTWALKPRPDSPARNELSVEVWIAPSLQYLPVRLRIRQDPEAVIDLTLSRPPQQAAQPVDPSPSAAPSRGSP